MILQELVKTVNGSCVECSSKEISVKNIVDKKKGWSNKTNISCCECRWTKCIYASKEANIPGQSRQKSHELNVSSVMAFCENVFTINEYDWTYQYEDIQCHQRSPFRSIFGGCW